MIIEQLLESLPTFRDELEAELKNVVDSVAVTRNAGEVTVKIKIAPKGANERGRLDVTPSVSAKVPREDPITGVFYITPEGNLSRRDSRQIDLEEFTSHRG